MQVYEDHGAAAAQRPPSMDLDRPPGLMEAPCQNTNNKAHTPSPEPKIRLSLSPSREIQIGFISTVREALCRSVRVSGKDLLNSNSIEGRTTSRALHYFFAGLVCCAVAYVVRRSGGTLQV